MYTLFENICMRALIQTTIVVGAIFGSLSWKVQLMFGSG